MKKLPVFLTSLAAALCMLLPPSPAQALLLGQSYPTTVTGTTPVELLNLVSATGVATIYASTAYPGQVYTVHMDGMYSTSLLFPSLTLTLKLGSTTLTTVSLSSLIGGATNAPLTLDIYIYAQAGNGTTNQAFVTTGYIIYASGGLSSRNFADVSNAGTPVAINTTVDQSISLTANWSASSGNSFTANTLYFNEQ